MNWKSWTLLLGIVTVGLLSQQVRAQSYSPGPAPIVGDIQTQCVEQYPAPQNRTDVGIGEDVYCWISSWSDTDIYTDAYGNQSNVSDSLGSIMWSVSGPGTIYPTVTYDLSPVTLTIDMVDADDTVTVIATARDSGTLGVDPAQQKQKVVNAKVPTGGIVIDITNNPPAAWQAGNANLGAQCAFLFRIQPATVNFGAVTFQVVYAGVPGFAWPDGTKDAIAGSTWGPWSPTAVGASVNLQTNQVTQDLVRVTVLAGSNTNYTNAGTLSYLAVKWKGLGDFLDLYNFQGIMNPNPPNPGQTAVGTVVSNNGNRGPNQWSEWQGPWK